MSMTVLMQFSHLRLCETFCKRMYTHFGPGGYTRRCRGPGKAHSCRSCTIFNPLSFVQAGMEGCAYCCQPLKFVVYFLPLHAAAPPLFLQRFMMLSRTHCFAWTKKSVLIAWQFPIGIDPDRFIKALETEQVKLHVKELLRFFAGRKVLHIFQFSNK